MILCNTRGITTTTTFCSHSHHAQLTSSRKKVSLVLPRKSVKVPGAIVTWPIENSRMPTWRRQSASRTRRDQKTTMTRRDQKTTMTRRDQKKVLELLCVPTKASPWLGYTQGSKATTNLCIRSKRVSPLYTQGTAWCNLRPLYKKCSINAVLLRA